MRYAAQMRAVLVMILTGCVAGSGEPVDPGASIVPGGSNGHSCRSDDSCPRGEVCARAGGCLPAGQVHAVHVTWTVNGMPANAITCSATPDLHIEFYTGDDASIGYAPVPCHEGKFSVDKLPRSYIRVALGKLRHLGDG